MTKRKDLSAWEDRSINTERRNIHVSARRIKIASSLRYRHRKVKKKSKRGQVGWRSKPQLGRAISSNWNMCVIVLRAGASQFRWKHTTSKSQNVQCIPGYRMTATKTEIKICTPLNKEFGIKKDIKRLNTSTFKSKGNVFKNI